MTIQIIKTPTAIGEGSVILYLAVFAGLYYLFTKQASFVFRAKLINYAFMVLGFIGFLLLVVFFV